ncbi:photosystem I reaction center subunit XI [Spirulina major CS-329]|jgi:photosystem I subunit 11|uniref:photosystem I reaction center subunit XI n=1 Tax=Spirulina TaxID=1154 RepID=UPI00232B9695|nr:MULTISPECIES: photosystem I reaction center subunit XI [Spirulina]MDB9493024.1 photosystem I reaction center subunit XI [Spirulina subsalsa CS-330]MDB9503387.1 photosystem I reaction center subunit XI [Spirulina major CS-329]
MALDVISDGGDPQVGNLATPVNSSGFTKALINNLPAYRAGLSANRRGLEVGMAHGYLLYGPFALLGPLRNTEYADLAGLMAAIGLVVILTGCLSIYGGVGSGKPVATVTTPNPPDSFATKEGWSDFASGFLLGGCGGAAFAYFIYIAPSLFGLA